MKRCGYVALLGEPNAGKSTLLNQILKVKLSIVTPKVQTTRRRLLGIHTSKDAQVIFFDTPGLFKPRRELEKRMVREAWQGAQEADLVVLLVDVTRENLEYSRDLCHKASSLGKPLVLLLNKVDQVDKTSLLDKATFVTKDLAVEKVFMISALKNKGVDDFCHFIEKSIPEGDWHFGEDQLSDTPLKRLMAELTREKIYLNVHQEIPYQLAVETEQWEIQKNNTVKISQVIHIVKENHKKIILGAGGKTLKRIGSQARQDMEKFLHQSVYLNLYVRVTENWMDRFDEI